jgi:hypothetical protein
LGLLSTHLVRDIFIWDVSGARSPENTFDCQQNSFLPSQISSEITFFLQRRTALGINQNKCQCGADNIIAASDSVSSRGRFRIKFDCGFFTTAALRRLLMKKRRERVHGQNSNQHRA